MALRGERFHIDLPEGINDHGDDLGSPKNSAEETTPSDPVVPVKDILERATNQAKAPSAPVAKPHSRGFPSHKKRNVSQFKLKQSSGSSEFENAANYVGRAPGSENVPSFAAEAASIDAENRQKLAAMSDADIDKERKELLEHLSPSLVERFLKRTAVEHPVSNESVRNPSPSSKPDEFATHLPANLIAQDTHATRPANRVQFKDEDAMDLHGQTATALSEVTSDKPDLAHETSSTSFHFPKPEQPPSLDPSSPSFLTDLHEKYFPSLPADPSKLVWMQNSRGEATYRPDAETVQIPNLRFNFGGSLITPRQAERISVTEGLHHHEDAASSAGYTVPELARLAHSSVAPQRCIAYQTLGRVMYRLGIGEFGDMNEQIPKGLWKCMQDGHVIETLQAEADRKTGHLSAKTYATEALWLWRKGGGYRLKAE